MHAVQRPAVVAWAAVALFSQLLVLNVAYANASFESSGTPMRDYFSPASLVSSNFANNLNVIADNLVWSVTTASQAAKQPVIAFLGIDQSYSFGQPRYTSLASQASLNPMNLSSQPQVLGAYTAVSSIGASQ